MTQFLLVLAVALTVGAIVFGVIAALTGEDPGLRPVEPDGRAVPLPERRPLVEADLTRIRFDTGWRGYRMAQVDVALRRVAYDLGYKDELVRVLEEEVRALREGRFPDAEVLRRAREAAIAGAEPLHSSAPEPAPAPVPEPAQEAQPEPEPALEPEPVPEPEPNPELESAPDAGPDSTPGPDSEPILDAEPQPQPEPTLDAEPEQEAEPDSGPDSDQERDVEDADIQSNQETTASGGSR